MSPLEVRVGAVVLALLALVALRGKRWAYLAFVVFGLLYFPAQTHFRTHPLKCDYIISTRVLVLSLQSYAQHYAQMALFAGFCLLSWVQFRGTKGRIVWAVLATWVVGALSEVAEGITARGHCHVRDLVPGAAAAVGAVLVFAFWSRLRRKPGYVRIARPHSAPAKRPAAIPPRPAPLSGIPTLPVLPQRVVPPPADFSPTPQTRPRGPTHPAPSEQAAPTEVVAPRRESATLHEIVQRFQALPKRLLAIRPQALLKRLLAMRPGTLLNHFLALGPRLWAVIRARRRAIVLAIMVLVLVSAAAVVLILVIPEPTPTTVAVQPAAPPPPPPPPRPLQSEAEGYYEPDYQFSIGDRRFLRLTLRPQAFLTFAKYGGRQQDGCAEARIGPSAVYVRCDVERVGMVTIDGRFTSRYATSRLDAGVLSASITVTNPRGEVLYRGHDSFRWHEPE